MIDTERLLSTFLDMVRIDSPSLGEKDMASHLLSLLRQRGCEAQMDDIGPRIGGNSGNIIARIPATGPGTPIAFSAHMDCVPPCLGVVPILENGVIRSQSATVLGSDDKAAIAAILEAAQHLKEAAIPHPELWLLFTVCEEAGMFGAKNLDLDSIAAREVVVLDAGGDVGTIIVRAPAKAGLTITFHGRAAHAGMEPENGISAIQIAAAAISQMRLLRIDEETVANLGRIEGGGQTNIVPDQIILTGEARAYTEERLQAQIAHMRECCAAAVRDMGGSFDFESEITYPALHVASDSALLQRAQNICKRLGLPTALKGTGGGSDANIFSAKGLSCINLGIGMSKVHTTEEFILVSDLEKTTQLTAALMQSEF